MKVKSESDVYQSCPTLRDPMDCSLPGSSVHGIFQARVLEWGAIAFSNQFPSRKEMDVVSELGDILFKIADLKSLSSSANTWASSGKVFTDFLPPPHCMGHTFLFLCMSCLLLKIAHLK